MSEQAIENEITEKGLNAPRLKPSDIDAVIVGETFTVLPSGKVMVCELTLRNGFTVRGEAATVSKANFDHEIGQKISRENARDKVWELEGYLLQQRVCDQKPVKTFFERLRNEKDELSEKHTKLCDFIGDGISLSKLPAEDQILLISQEEAMDRYLHILADRIALIETRTANG